MKDESSHEMETRKNGMNRPAMNGKDAVRAVQDEAVREIRSTLKRICIELERQLNRRPTTEELETILKGALETLENGQASDWEGERLVHSPVAGPESRETGNSCMADKPCTCRIPTFEAAKRIAEEIVEGNRQCRFISGEMSIKKDGETVSLMEEQMLSDGTRILGRSFTFDTGNEAVEAVAKILWESARLLGEASAMIPLESQESDSCQC